MEGLAICDRDRVLVYALPQFSALYYRKSPRSMWTQVQMCFIIRPYLNIRLSYRLGYPESRVCIVPTTLNARSNRPAFSRPQECRRVMTETPTGRRKRFIDPSWSVYTRFTVPNSNMRCLRGQILVVPGYGAVNLYKIQKNGAIETTEIAARLAGGKQRAKGQLDPDVHMSDGIQDDDAEEGDFPEVRLDELLEEFDEMTLQDSGVQP